MSNVTAMRRTDLRSKQVAGQSRLRYREIGFPWAFDLEEPDCDPDGELVRPNGGQVQNALEPFRTKVRALPSIWRRARPEVNVLNIGTRHKVDSTAGEKAEVAVDRRHVYEGIASLAGVAGRDTRVVVGDLEQATRWNRRRLAGCAKCQVGILQPRVPHKW